MLISHVDSITPRLTQAAADTLVGKYDRGQESRIFDRHSFGVDLRSDPCEFNRVVTGMVTFIDAKLTRFATRMRQTGLQIDLSKANPADLFLGQRNRADRSRRANLSTGVAPNGAAPIFLEKSHDG